MPSGQHDTGREERRPVRAAHVRPARTAPRPSAAIGRTDGERQSAAERARRGRRTSATSANISSGRGRNAAPGFGRGIVVRLDEGERHQRTAPCRAPRTERTSAGWRRRTSATGRAPSASSGLAATRLAPRGTPRAPTHAVRPRPRRYRMPRHPRVGDSSRPKITPPSPTTAERRAGPVEPDRCARGRGSPARASGPSRRRPRRAEG